MLPFLKKELDPERDNLEDDLELADLDVTILDDGITEDEITHDEHFGLTPDELKDDALPITSPPTFQDKFYGLRNWFIQRRLRDLKIMLFLYDASRVDSTREFTLTEIASGLHMSANSMCCI
ncbi:hypothetical protein [Ktedonobacter racemifer]|uniref:Uncharacterized protein n=1 Tax=Ktedonobacter racemifer DSM 44963 TaxID=485913 RepID=D6TVK2_KTERA|nr:hypothetical protein [Ktedonobacter racemifer]EFH85405.1 hypothetical protein Krac_6625 [Ktedonobacter racemifer DSM 44963]